MKYEACRTCTAMKAASYCGVSFVIDRCECDCKYNKGNINVSRRIDPELRSLQFTSMSEMYAEASGKTRL